MSLFILCCFFQISIPGYDCRTFPTHLERHGSQIFCSRLIDYFSNGRTTCEKYFIKFLFKQGVVSAELFAGDADFRRKVNDKLPEAHKLADPLIRPNLGDYSVVFTIISKSPNPLNLPFFSKVSFRNARRRLEGYGYKVYKKKVRAIGNEVA